MKIAIIGSGNIATFFSTKFHQQRNEIIQVISSTLNNAKELASNFDCNFTSQINELSADAEVVILAVKDDVISSIIDKVDFKNRILIHTAGSVTLENILLGSKNVGSIWCMYSINKNYLPERENIPLIINASNSETLDIVKKLSACISSSIFLLSDEQKLRAHLAAVFANNFANHMFTIGQDILQKENISFDLLIPLIENTVEKLMYSAPDKLQTGPAIRHDQHTIGKHQLLLNEHEDYKKIYELLTESIQRKYQTE